MADVVDLLAKRLDSSGVASLAEGLGIDPGDAKRVIDIGLPILLERLSSNAKKPGGAELVGAINADHDGSVLQSSSYLAGGFKSGPGMAVLGHVFGDEMQGVVSSVSQKSGVPEPIVSMAMSALAPLALGAVTKAAIGVVTVVVAVKLLDVAVDKARDGSLQRMVGNVNDLLDRDGDGSGVDDVAKGVVSTGKTIGSQTKRAVTSKRAKSMAGSATRNGRKAARRAGRTVKAKGPKLARRAGRTIKSKAPGLAKGAAGAAKKGLGRLFGR